MRSRLPGSTLSSVLTCGALALVLHGCNAGDQAAPPAPSTDQNPVLPDLEVVLSPASATTGQWSAPFSWPTVAVHLALLPNGEVMSYGRKAGGVPQVWNPGTGGFVGVPSPSLLFCSAQVLLSDGRLFVAGGHIADGLGLPNGNIYRPYQGVWQSTPAMARGRWYPTATPLANGEVLVLGGTDQNGATVTVPEVWRTSGGWRSLTNAAKWLPYYPRTFLAPNGQVFYAGEMQQTYYLNPAGNGAWTYVADRQHANRDYGSAVMYQPGKILYMGGGDPPTATAEVIDLNQPAPAWRFTGSMTTPRRQMNATILPTGEVLALGGTTSSGFNSPAGAVHHAEVWNPVTETWTALAANSVTRIYHGTSVLLPDGRVLFTGSGDAGGAVDEFNAELFSPPYLFKGPRPTITSIPATVRYGQRFTIGTPDAATIARVTWVRLGSSTHAFDMGQRFHSTQFTRAANALSVNLPANKNRIPPGHYMIFLLDPNGVPSVARIVKVM